MHDSKLFFLLSHHQSWTVLCRKNGKVEYFCNPLYICPHIQNVLKSQKRHILGDVNVELFLLSTAAFRQDDANHATTYRLILNLTIFFLCLILTNSERLIPKTVLHLNSMIITFKERSISDESNCI